MAIWKSNRDIYIDQFDCGIDVDFTLSNKDGEEFDLTDYTVQFIVKKQKEDADTEAIVNKFMKYEGNVITLAMDKELASTPVGVYYYAIRLFKEDHYVNTIVQAKLNIVDNTFENGAEEWQ